MENLDLLELEEINFPSKKSVKVRKSVNRKSVDIGTSAKAKYIKV